MNRHTNVHQNHTATMAQWWSEVSTTALSSAQWRSPLSSVAAQKQRKHVDSTNALILNTNSAISHLQFCAATVARVTDALLHRTLQSIKGPGGESLL